MYTLNFAKKALSKIDSKRFWLNPNELVVCSHPKIDEVRKENKDDVYLELDGRRKISPEFEENDGVNCRKSKFYEDM